MRVDGTFEARSADMQKGDGHGAPRECALRRALGLSLLLRDDEGQHVSEKLLT